MSKIKTIYDLVCAKLANTTKCRDDDNLLVVSIWCDELENNGYDRRTITAFEFMTLYKSQKLTCSDAITRARRKAQDEFPSLRGRTYHYRQAKAEEVKDEVKSLDLFSQLEDN